MKTLKFFRNKAKAKEYRKRNKRKNYLLGNFKDRPLKRFTEEEIDLVLDHKMKDRQLAFMLKRSVQSIQAKRTRLLNT